MASRSRSRSLTTRGRSLLACGIVLVGAGVLLGFRDLTRIGVLLVLLPLLARLLARHRVPRMSIDRTVAPMRLQPDETAEVSVEFSNLGNRSTTLYTAEEQVAAVLGDPPRFMLPRLRAGHRRRVTYQVHGRVRGRHQLGPISLSQRDPFGLTRVELVVRSEGEVVIRPRLVPLGPGQPSGAGYGIEGEVPQMVALHGEDDVSIRTYRDGDDLRKVHWPATAHRGELMVRQEDRPARRSAVLLLDSRASGHTEGLFSESFEWSVSALASIAVRLSGLGYTLHLATRESLAAGDLDRDLDAETVMELLTTAERGSDVEHEHLVRATHDLTERTGGLVAALTSADDLTLQDVATLRRPGTSAQALVIDAAAFAAPGRPVSEIALTHQQLLHEAGWRAVTVDAQASIVHTWDLLTATGRSQRGVA